ncbi:MAG: hypothetical protein Q8P95_01800, partial [bacterium]|nr:hypothetical protein [bacterium]
QEQSQIFESNQNADANDIDVVGDTAYMVTDWQGGFDNFRVLDVTDPTNVTELGSLSLESSVNGIVVAVQGNYAYVGTNKSDKELIVIDVSDSGNPFVAITYNVPHSEEPESIWVSGNYVYLGMEKNSDQEFYIFDVQTPTNPTIVGQYEIGDDVAGITVNNNIAYLAIDHPTNTLRVLDVSNPSSIQLLATHTVTSEEGEDVAYMDGKIYFVSEETGSGDEFIIVDVSTPSNPTVPGGVDLDTEGRAVDVFDTYAFLTTAENNKEFQIIDISSPNNPQLVETFDLGSRGNGLKANANAVYVTSDNNSSALYIFTYPVPVYFGSGNYTSQEIDSGSSTTKWLTFNWEGTVPTGTSLNFQIRTADTEGNLASAIWVGPDGTNGTSYTANQTIITTSPDASGTRWIQYRVNMTSDGDNTPEVTDIRIQYRP